MQRSWRELIGWCGVTAILIAYVGVNFGKIDQQSTVYHLLNLLGAVAIGLDAWKHKNYQPVFLNIIWAGVAAAGLIQIIG